MNQWKQNLEETNVYPEWPKKVWSAESVRDELPDVTVRIDDEILTAVVRGRMNQYATVHCDKHGHSGNGYTFAWGTIACALNNGRPLIV